VGADHCGTPEKQNLAIGALPISSNQTAASTNALAGSPENPRIKAIDKEMSLS
jgi:hypothetical protein